MTMSEENIFAIKNRVAEVFKLHGTVPPEPRFNEGPVPYRARALSAAQTLLPRNHVWSGVNIARQPERALDSIERALVHDRVAAFKAPTGPLREMTETCPRTGRATTKFFGDPEECWKPFKGVRQRVVGWTSQGRGSDSPHARAERAAAANEMALAYQALDAQRAAEGLR
jgi:hypothetical protein